MVKIENLFQINDWEIKKFIRIVISIQLALWGSIGMDLIGLNVLILRPLISFIYLTFIPGFLILRILKLHKLGNINSLLYATGLSIFTVMVVGVVTNNFLSFIGILNPLSIKFLIITMSIVVIVLTILSYFIDKNYAEPEYINLLHTIAPAKLLLYQILFLTIVGVYVFNSYGNNVILMIIILLISLIPILISFNYIPSKLHESVIFIVAISLLYHRSLISAYLFGWDINVEYYFARLVQETSFWDANMYSNVNGILSTVMLAPIYSNVSGLSLIWTFKIIFPLLFSLVPLALYSIFEKQTDRKIAFLSTFFFMAVYSFYAELPILPRQEIAELFLVLLVSVMLNTDLTTVKKRILLNIFAISIIVTHYALAFIFMGSIIFCWILLFLIDETNIKSKLPLFNIDDNLFMEECSSIEKKSSEFKPEILRLPFVMLFVVFTISWYITVSNADAFVTLVHITNNIITSITEQFLNPEVADGVRILNTGSTSSIYKILKYLHVLSMLFISLGILELITKFKALHFGKEYSILSVFNYLLCIGGIVLPFFASSVSVARLYHMTLLFLAPFCIIGGIRFLNVFSRFFKSALPYKGLEMKLKLLSVFFAVFLLFNSGFIHEVLKDENPASISLNKSLDYPLFTFKEVSGASWIMNYTDSKLVYADPFGKPLLYGYISPIWNVKSFHGDVGDIQNNAYIFLRKINIEGKIMVPSKVKSYERPYSYIDIKNSIFYKDVLVHRHLIYANGGSEVYR